MQISLLSLERNIHDKKIGHYKERICAKLKALGAPSDAYFDCGEWVNEIINAAFQLGVIQKRMDDENI